MNPALWLLVGMTLRARFRRMTRALGTLRGIFFVAVGVGVLVLPVAMSTLGDGGGSTAGWRRFGPVGFATLALLSLFSSARYRGVYFSPGEVDLLFPAPFSRRELLGYRMVMVAIQVLLSALFLAAMLQRNLASYWRGVAGLFLALVFSNLIQIAASLVSGSVEERTVARSAKASRLFLLALAGLVATGVAFGDASGAWRDRLTEILDSRLFGWFLFPFTVFAEAIAAESFARFWPWALGGVASCTVLAAFVLFLDRDCREASLETSRKVHARLERARAGGRVVVAERKLKVSLPIPARLGGVGPLAWRQTLELLREMPAAARFLIVIAIAALVPSLALGHKSFSGVLASTAPLFVVGMPFFLSSWLRFDFRGDQERLPFLLSLPLRPSAVVLGQLVAPTAVLSAIMGLGILLLAIVSAAPADLPLNDALVHYGPILLVPVNLLVIAVENFFFLLMPRKSGPSGPGDFLFVGRAMVSMLAKVLVLGVVAALSALAAFGVMLVAPESGGVAAAAVLVVVILADFAAVVGLAALFARLDLSIAAVES